MVPFRHSENNVLNIFLCQENCLYYTIIMNLRKTMAILEIPLYLLIIGIISLDKGYVAMSACLIVLSIIRLWVNTVTYKEK